MPKISLFFVTFLGMTFAQEQTAVDIRSIAQPMTDDAARQVWAAINGGTAAGTDKMASVKMGAGSGLPDLQYPQAAGVVQVVAEPNQGSGRTVRFVATKPIRGVIAAWAVLPNGDQFRYQLFDLDRCCGGGPVMVYMDLWSGAFPANWSAGLMRFYVFNFEDGRVSQATAYVNVNTWGVVPEPNVGNISVVNTDGGRQALVSPGQFKSKDLAIIVGFASAAEQFSVGPFGNLVISIPAEKGISPGNTTVTICESGLCGTRTFFYNPFPYPQPQPGPPPGKG